MRRLSVLFLSVLLVTTLAGPASAYGYPSTNDQNCANDDACVTVVDTEPGQVTLQFANPDDYTVCFEYRTDGDTSQATGDPNFNPEVEDLYPFLCTRAGTVTRTFSADEYVEIRSTFGAERDQDFDWTRFDVGADARSRENCRDGGWQTYGFDNQGQCVRFVTTGKDSR